MKKQFSKLLALILALVLSLGTVPTASAYATPDFTDVPQSSWAYHDIMEMADLGVIKGTGGGRFAPQQSLTVAEFLALIGRSMYPADCNESGTSVWWETYYMTAVDKGIIKMTEFGTVDMERAITRNEMARILVRVDELVIVRVPVTADTSKITDYAKIPETYRYFVEQAYTKGLLNGDSKGNFNGSDYLIREQAAAVIKRLLKAEKGIRRWLLLYHESYY